VIARIWRGAVRPEDADSYAAYMRETGVGEYRTTPGTREPGSCTGGSATWPRSSPSRCGTTWTRCAGSLRRPVTRRLLPRGRSLAGGAQRRRRALRSWL